MALFYINKREIFQLQKCIDTLSISKKNGRNLEMIEFYQKEMRFFSNYGKKKDIFYWKIRTNIIKSVEH